MELMSVTGTHRGLVSHMTVEGWHSKSTHLCQDWVFTGAIGKYMLLCHWNYDRQSHATCCLSSLCHHIGKASNAERDRDCERQTNVLITLQEHMSKPCAHENQLHSLDFPVSRFHKPSFCWFKYLVSITCN